MRSFTGFGGKNARLEYQCGVRVHDRKKPDLIEFAQTHESQLRTYQLTAAGTTGKRLLEDTPRNRAHGVRPARRGLMISTEVVAGNLDGVVFLCDPLRAQPHEPDISALATNLASATFLIEGLAE